MSETRKSPAAATDRAQSKTSNPQDIRSALLGAMRDAGLEPTQPGDVVLDGALHRFHVDGDRTGRCNGWLIGYNDDRPAARFGSWRTGVVRSWRADRYCVEKTASAIERLGER